MKIEANRFYKTRDGRKARIYATDGKGTYSVHGSIDGYPFIWGADGKFDVRCGHSDLVAEWTEPKPRLKAWISDIGTIQFSEKKPLLNADTWTHADWLDQPEEGK